MASNQDQDKQKLTPYQGPDRVYGRFRCPKCDGTWSSGNTWANLGQNCRTCGSMVYPYEQRAIRRHFVDETKPHRQDLCGKCQQLGRPCDQ